MIRYHLDQHIDSAIARGLRLRGIDVTTTADAGLQNAKDADHIAFALREGRVIFTRDDDFIRFHSEGVTHAGIVYARQGTHSIGEVVHLLDLMSQCLTEEEMAGQLQYL